tara:strand:+ start:148 stop:732 length:585 start_codon:yes stop_codon:yes gene_type:complete
LSDQNMGVVMDIAKSYGEFQRDIVETQNEELVKTAQKNYDVAEQQIEDAAAEQSYQLSLQYQKARGAALAMAAYRGVSEPTAEAQAESYQAARARRSIEINAANSIASAAAQAQVQLQDPNLAQFQGTMEGLRLGSSLAEAQANMPYNTVYNTEYVETGIGWQPITTATRVQDEIDLSGLLEGLNPEWAGLFGG